MAATKLIDSASVDNRLRPSSMLSWARLVRVPAVFTVIAQVVAAFLLAGGKPEAMLRLVVVCLAGVAIYWAGMILNDVWDVDEDRRERPSRPLPSGEIDTAIAAKAAWICLAAGVIFAALSGFLPGGELATTFCPGIIGAVLAICVFVYNSPLKATALSPLAMGICRALCFLLGAATVTMVGGENMGDVANWFAPQVVAAALGFGVYVMGITTISKSETVGGNSIQVGIGTVIVILGAVCLALVPQYAPAGTIWKVSFGDRFGMLIGLIAFTIVFRGIRVAIHPEIPAIQSLVRIGIMTIIPFSAIFAMIAAGPVWGIAVFSLSAPALITAAKIRVT